MTTANTPGLWQALLPRPDTASHKYTRGHAVVMGGTRMTGAARLASEAAMRAGAGLCTILAAPAACPVYLTGAPHVLVEAYPSLSGFASRLSDKRRNALLLGSGAGREEDTALKQAILTSLQLGRSTVLDGDGLTVFETDAAALLGHLHAGCILTPHEGEFARLFPRISGERADKAREAAASCRAVIVLKGAQTVIAAPDGRCVTNSHATPWLATAGSGDVLAGIILGLVAQGMPAFEAACAAVWMHGDAGLRHGTGLIAPDLIALLPVVMKELLSL